MKLIKTMRAANEFSILISSKCHTLTLDWRNQRFYNLFQQKAG